MKIKTYKHKILVITLLFTTLIFAQKHDKKVSETFNVNSDAIVDITTRYADVTIETWNKNTVSVEGVWETDGLSKDESNKLFDNVNFEALGNMNKVVITSKSNRHNALFITEFDDFDFNFNFDSIANIGNLFSHDFHFEIPEAPEMPEMPEMPEIAETPEMPEIMISHLSKIEFDHEEYEKDKEGYMLKFKKKQEDWEKELEEKIEPQMKAYEKQMEKWEKENAPRLKKMEEKMAKWHKENEPKMKEFELKMQAWEKENEPKMKAFELKMEKMGKEMEAKYNNLIESKHKNHGSKIKKTLLIKIPKTAKVKLDVRYGSFKIPDNLNTVD
jgi:hypothetical protein